MNLEATSSTSVSVAWIGASADPYLAVHLDSLERLGLTIEVCEVQHSPQVLADVRVLTSWAFDRFERLQVEYPLDPRPTLLLCETADGVDELLQIARNSDDVGHAGETPRTLARRIARIAGLAESYRRAGEAGDHDALTGLWNRRRMGEEIERALEDSAVSDDALGLLFLDMDGFKNINDLLGHHLGDKVLRMSAAAIRRGLQRADLASRNGGDEFLVLIRRGSETEVLESAELIREQLGRIDFKGHGLGNGSIEVSASGGLAFYRPGLSQHDWFQRADMAAYEAKSRGRGRLVSYDALAAPMGESRSDLQVRHFQNVTRVVTERVASLISLMGQQVVRSIQSDANQDALTAIFNRRYFDSRITREFGLASKDSRPLTLIFLDIDHFGRFNRVHGAPTGDAVLRQFAQVVSSAIRPVDWMARYGGEEFCVVMPASLDEALVVAERLRATVAEAALMTFEGQSVQITVSIGVAEHVVPTESPDDLLQRASKALQEAKRLGRDRVQAAPT